MRTQIFDSKLLVEKACSIGAFADSTCASSTTYLKDGQMDKWKCMNRISTSERASHHVSKTEIESDPSSFSSLPYQSQIVRLPLTSVCSAVHAPKAILSGPASLEVLLGRLNAGGVDPESIAFGVHNAVYC